jgi:hypothetical protein
MCSACDPDLDEHGSEWLCDCRQARGDANWRLPDELPWFAGLGTTVDPQGNVWFA